MTPLMQRRGRTRLAALALAATTLATGAAQLPALATSASPVLSSPSIVTPGDAVAALSDIDSTGAALPSLTQRRAADALHATVRWNTFGTPASIYSPSGSLGRASSSNPVQAARNWLGQHSSVLGISANQLSSLELVNSQKFAQSSARAVLFQQKFGGLAPANGSLVTVGVANGNIVYVSSSLTRTTASPVQATLTPLQGWIKAAASVGRAADLALVSPVTKALGWSRFSVPGFAQQQLARTRALAFADGSVRPVIQADVVDAQGGQALGYTVLVDAVTGKVLWRHNVVDNEGDIVTDNNSFSFSGAITATDCGPKHPFTLTDNNTHQIVVVAGEAVTSNDIVIKLWSPLNQLLASGDTGTSPEALTYTSALIPAGTYSAQVCPFDSPTVPFSAPGDYAGTIIVSDQGAPSGPSAPFPPKWRYFVANPTINFSASNTPTNSVIGCWVKVAGCTAPTALSNIAAAGPWDTIAGSGAPTFTTLGNAANTHEAWGNPLAPGGTAQAPTSSTREYTEAFTDAWNNSKCDPSELHPAGNDINASVGNLFVSHNRMHDWSYYLGFTEANYNLQTNNLGRNPDPAAQNDAEIGNAQAGALSGGQPSLLGRDNANQITEQDGTPGITNQYLFQPIAGAFYAPCIDGALDMGIVGHEYTHAISNRMIGGPNDSITSNQGGAMGESWSDLDAMEYQFANDYRMGSESPYVLAGYATGNTVAGIRDFPINKDPLNYSDVGFDTTGPEVHADGEIWNGTQWSVRQALVNKWNAKFPYANKALQKACGSASPTSSPLPSTRCPGNRRWIQLVFDSFLLQQGATSMLDARDAMLAADQMRYHGANQAVMWKAFATRGMGAGAKTPNADSDKVKPSFASPKAKNATITFKAPAGSNIFVGNYEARVDPIADTKASTKTLGAKAKFVPGTYKMLLQAPGRGLKRFTMTVKAGQIRTVTVQAPVNLASLKSGAKVLGSTAGSLNVDWLFDDTEATNWGGVNGGQNVDASHPFVSVDLAGGVRTVHRVQVSAYLRPPPATATDGLPVLVGGVDDPDSGSRFTALRQFGIDACVSNCASANAKWVRIFTSKANAFPGVRPRPVSPNLTLRSFDVKDVKASALRLVVLENQCTGYAGYAGEQDNDAVNDTDCKSASDRGQFVHVAEFQVF
jgi:extracellular elastinolytic metalloproteinase